MKCTEVRVAILAVLPLAVLPTISWAATLLTVPPGLNPGDQYRIVFVTSTVRDATSTNIADYNTFVNNAANAAGSELQSLGVNWKVIGSTDSVSALINIGGPSSIPIYLLDGTLVASGTADLFDGSIDQGIQYFETGDHFLQDAIWTGTDSNGLPIAGVALGDAAPIYGVARSDFLDHNWIFYSLQNPPEMMSFYGISDNLTVPGAPEPGSVGLVLAGLGVLIQVQRRRGAETFREP